MELQGVRCNWEQISPWQWSNQGLCRYAALWTSPWTSFRYHPWLCECLFLGQHPAWSHMLYLVIMCPWLFYSGMFFCLSLSFTTLRLLKINGWDWSHVPQFGFVRCFLTIQFRSCILGENIIHDSLLPSASCRESHDVGVTPLVPTWITC